MPPGSLTHLKKGLELCVAAINGRQGKDSRAFSQCLVSLQNPASLRLPNLHAVGVSKVIHLYFFSHRPRPNYKEAEKLSKCGKRQGKATA